MRDSNNRSTLTKKATRESGSAYSPCFYCLFCLVVVRRIQIVTPMQELWFGNLLNLNLRILHDSWRNSLERRMPKKKGLTDLNLLC